MADMEKVVKGLEMCIRHGENAEVGCGRKNECPYEQVGLRCWLDLNRDALALLKEKEHSSSFIVIDTKTGKEADQYAIALHEEWAKHLCYCDMDGWALQDDGSLLLLDECGRYAYADRERFKVVWNG